MPTLADAKNATDEGNLQQARLIYEAILQEDRYNEDAWIGLADVLPDAKDKRICYENVLRINNDNQVARENLRNLEPQANPLVAALQKQSGYTESEDEETDEEEIEEDTRTPSSPPRQEESEGGTSLGVLVAAGLALSVVVFAIGGGIIFMIINSFISP